MAADDRPAGLSRAVFDGRSYSGATAHHRAYDDAALTGLPLAPGRRVVDLGCGVGDLTSVVADRVDAGGPDGGWVLGLDASPSCLAVAAQHRRDGLAFVAARAQDLGDVVAPESLDAVLSVAVLHWVAEGEQEQVLAGVAAALAPDGVLRVDMGGAGQIAEVRHLLAPLALAAGAPACPWFFPTAVQMGELLVRSGLRVDVVRTVRQRRSVPDAEAMRTWLQSQVLPAYVADVPPQDREAFCREALSLCLEGARRADGTYDQDYVRIHLVAGRRTPGTSQSFSGADAVVADCLAALAALLEQVTDAPGVDESRKPLLSKRFRRAAAMGRHDAPKALEALGELHDDVWRSLHGRAGHL